MSHFKQRKQTNCLNCNAEVLGRYCQICGQENVEPKQSLGHLLSHFFNDITHFDGKFFSTLGTLILRPGYLTTEYVRGRRMSYLDPIRMYIFTSAIFFLVFFKYSHYDNEDKEAVQLPAIAEVAMMTDSQLHAYTWEQFEDSLMPREKAIRQTEKALRRDSINNGNILKTNFNAVNVRAKNVKQYDSLQQQLPLKDRDGFMKRQLVRKELALNEKFQRDPGNFNSEMVNGFFHRLPQLLFISLPFFALILKLLYIRRKEHYYTDHGIFTFHLYIFGFITLLVQFGLKRLGNLSGWSIWNILIVLLILWLFIYLYKAMRNFYQQGRAKTILKFMLLNVCAFVLILLLAGFFFVFNLITIA